MVKCMCHILAIFAAVTIIITKEVGQLPNSPCRSIFTYKTNNDTGEVYGYLQFPNDFSGEYQLEIRMSVAKRTSESIIIFRIPTEDDIQCGKDLEYEVHFSCHDVIPTLTFVKYNSKIYCTGPPAKGSNPFAVTQLQEYDALVTEINHTCVIQQISNGHITTTPVAMTTTPRPFVPRPKREGCGILDESTVGGREHYPWLATIYHPHKVTNYSATYVCSGALISNSHIVTVAHCIPSSYVMNNITIRLGRNNIKTAAISSAQDILRQVKSISIHPSYFGEPNNRMYNIAIMEFTKPVEFNDLIGPICLWTGSIKVDDIVSQIGSVIGWGPDAKPRIFPMPIVSYSTCLKSNAAFQSLLGSTSFCAGYRNGSVPCVGNSGGTMMLKKEDGRYYLRGLTAAGIPLRGGCDGYAYTLFTDTAQLGSWIHSIIDASNSTG